MISKKQGDASLMEVSPCFYTYVQMISENPLIVLELGSERQCKSSDDAE